VTGFDERVSAMIRVHERRTRRCVAAGGFTLIELMVALALAAMLSIMIMMISTTAQETYTQTVQRVEVYNQFRLVIDRLREDISNWIPSQELEYYTDGKGKAARRNFHYEPGEEVVDQRDEHGAGVVDGGTIGKYDEYAYIEQAHYRSIEKSQLESGDRNGKIHDAYRMYFRTMTYIDGQVREANVEYLLADPGKRKGWINGVPPPPRDVRPEDVRNLALYKVVRYLKINDRILMDINKVPIERRIIEVATNVTDFRVEYTTQNSFSRSKRVGGPKFVTPEQDYDGPAERATRPVRQRKRAGEVAYRYRKEFGYGSVSLSKKFDLATATPAKFGDQGLTNLGTLSEPVRIGFRRNPNIVFAELAPGDQIYVFTQSERGVQRAGGNSAGRLAAFPAGTYSVKSNTQGMLEVVEDIDSSTWGSQDQTGIYYKAAFLPAAVRITLRMVDNEGLNPKTMQQVVALRRKTR